MGPELIFLIGGVALCWLAGFVVLRHTPDCRDLSSSNSPRSPNDFADVAIVIPARDEEANLPPLLRSIAAQSVRHAQVLVVDDGSTDRTAGVAAEYGATVLRADPPPAGWRGKTWACAQGAEVTAARDLLFLDADTRLEPHGLARVLAAYQAAGRDAGGQVALSACPYHVVPRAYEQLSAVFHLVMAAGVGAFAAWTARRPGAFGQMLLVSRESYQRAGGHAAVKDRALETVWLARRLTETGTPVRCALGRGAVTMRMYPGGLRTLTDGWAKGFAAGAGTTSPLDLAFIIAWLSGAVSATTLFFKAPLPIATAAYACYVLQYFVLLRRLGSYWRLTAMVYPIPLLFFFAVFFLSLVRRRSSARWKGRKFDAR